MVILVESVVRRLMMAVWGLTGVWWMWLTPLSPDDSLPSFPHNESTRCLLFSQVSWFGYPRTILTPEWDLGVRIMSHEHLACLCGTPGIPVPSFPWPVLMFLFLFSARERTQPGRECTYLSCLRWPEPGARYSSIMCLRDPQPGAECYLSSSIAPYAIVPGTYL